MKLPPVNALNTISWETAVKYYNVTEAVSKIPVLNKAGYRQELLEKYMKQAGDGNANWVINGIKRSMDEGLIDSNEAYTRLQILRQIVQKKAEAAATMPASKKLGNRQELLKKYMEQVNNGNVNDVINDIKCSMEKGLIDPEEASVRLKILRQIVQKKAEAAATKTAKI